MKNIFRTSIILLLVLGLGVSVPKIMNSRAIDNPTSEGRIPSEVETDSIVLAKQNQLNTLNNQNSLTEILVETTDFEQETEENKGNFPIETDSQQNAVEVEPKVESPLQNEQKDDNSSKVDNSSTSVVEPVKTEPVKTETKAPETAPIKEAPTEVNASYDRYVKSSLNVRTGPGTSYEKISTLKTGEKVHVTAIVSNGWSLIETNGITGYVSNSYLLKTAPAPAPVAPSAAKPQAPVEKPSTPAPTPPKEEPAKPSTPSYSANRMIVGGKTLPYKNGGISGGQGIIDGNNGMLSTWGGAETYSGSDGYNTHFIGHNPGAFSVLLKLSTGSTIIVTDGNANATTYVVTNIFTVDDNANNKNDGENYYNYMVSKRGGEVITLQTCLSSDENLIIRAEKR